MSSTPTSSAEKSEDPTVPTLPKWNLNIQTKPIEIKDYYGRTWLEKQQNGAALVWVYDSLADAVFNMKDEITVYNADVKITETEWDWIYACFTQDFPQYFWLDHMVMTYDIYGMVHEVKPQYNMTVSQKETAFSQFTAAVEHILSGISNKTDAYTIEKTIHDRLVLQCTYQQGKNMHNAYGALVEGTAVCDGYAEAFQLLCRLAGLQTITVTGVARPTDSMAQEAHAWNMVKVDGSYYCVDVTWDDTNEPDADEIHYAYFNLTSAQMALDHTPTASGQGVPPLPTATATAANYYVRNDLTVTQLSTDRVAELILRSAQKCSCVMWLEDPSHIAEWLQNNAVEIGTKIGLQGSFSAGWAVLGHEVQVMFVQL